MPLRALRSLCSISAATLTASAVLVSGCAGISSPGTSSYVDLDSPAMRSFAVASTTDLERDVRIETGARKHEKLPTTLFWTGIGLGTLGAVGGVAFGVAGFVTKNQLNDAYNDGSGLTVDEQQRLIDNGEVYNTLAITFSALAVVGYALAVTAWGIDWTRCGPLAEKKRRCKELGLGSR